MMLIIVIDVKVSLMIRKINENERVNALKHIIRIQPYNIYGMRR